MANFYDAVIRETAQLSAANAQLNDGDFIKEVDGKKLVHCGKCHTPKQTVISYKGIEQTVWQDCDCRHAEWLKEQSRFHEHVTDAVKESRRSVCFQNAPDFVRSRFENDDGKGNREIMIKLRKYAENFKEPYQRGLGLLLYGNFGTGKSYGAACIANKIIDYGYSALFINFSQLFNALWALKDKQEYINDLNGYDLLIIDDYGAERSGEYACEIITNVLDGRYNSGKPMILTTNFKPADFECQNSNDPKAVQHERVMSRILGRCLPIAYVGEDRRRKALNANAEFFKQFFNGN